MHAGADLGFTSLMMRSAVRPHSNKSASNASSNYLARLNVTAFPLFRNATPALLDCHLARVSLKRITLLVLPC